MKNSRSHQTLRILLLALVGAALTACHFHGHGYCGGYYRPSIRICR